MWILYLLFPDPEDPEGPELVLSDTAAANGGGYGLPVPTLTGMLSSGIWYACLYLLTSASILNFVV
jgi:hypothetical protein